MEKFYTIKDNHAEIILNRDMYPLISVKKAVANFMEDAYMILKSDKDKIIIQIQLKENTNDLENIIGELYNELLRESLRYDIALETKNLRELIVGRALYTTCIDLDGNKHENEDKEKSSSDEYKIDDIAVNWFDKYNKEEE